MTLGQRTFKTKKSAIRYYGLNRKGYSKDYKLIKRYIISTRK